jgi:hypothetical protein
MVANFPVEVVDSAWKEIPREWLQDDDEEELEKLLESLLKRRNRVTELIYEIRRKRTGAFANWR